CRVAGHEVRKKTAYSLFCFAVMDHAMTLMANVPFQFFGSASSQDLDAAFFVPQIGSIETAAAMCKLGSAHLRELGFCDRPINTNLAVSGRGGHLVQVFKGTTDELNNALLATYPLHEQRYPNQVGVRLRRDLDLKILRCARKLLSFFTRTTLRVPVKLALKSDLSAQLQLLSEIQLHDFDDFGKKGTPVEFGKAAAFQLGQTLALVEGVECYTKEAIADRYPALTDSIRRDANADTALLQPFLECFVAHASARLPYMKHLQEYPYEI
ncbi:MAG: hypothetical protein AAGJ35_10135, partial [Myxococcota bacterium]